MSDCVIKLNNICKVFETEIVETHALKNLSLTINKGDYISISGPSGCGKSTLLSILGLLDAASSGEYHIDGQNISNLTFNQASEIRNKKIGFVFQSFNLIDELTVFDNVALPLEYSSDSITQNEIRERVNSCLEKLGITARAEHFPNQLSGGQQQRVAIARALVMQPSILLVDEPTGNLDSNSGEAVMEVLSELNKNGTTICLVTHDYRFADMATTRLRMLDGSLEFEEAVCAS